MASRSASRSSDLAPGQRLVVALVRGVHGLRGAVRVEVLTDRPGTRFRRGAVVFREGSDAPLTITSASPVADGPGWRLSFQEVPDRTAAETLRGAYLEAIVDPAATLARGEYLWHEVLGSAVRDVDGTELGRVHDIYRVAETEVLVVRGGPHGEFDVPVVRSLIRVFAPRRGEIVVDGAALDLGASPASRPRPARRRRTAAAGHGESIAPSSPPAAGPGGPIATTRDPDLRSGGRPPGGAPTPSGGDAA
jgi:16S rRNA processing protein RimM